METKPSTAHCHCEPLGAPRRGNLYETELLNANLTSFGERPLAFSLLGSVPSRSPFPRRRESR